MHVVLRRLLVLVADELDELLIGDEPVVDAHRPRPRVGLGVLDGDVELEPAVGDAAESLGDARRAAEVAAVHVEPAVVAEPHRLHHERVAFPPSHRVALPPRLRIVGRQRPAVEQDVPQAAVGLVGNQHLVAGLDDLARLRVRVLLHQPDGQAVGVGVVRREGGLPLLAQLRRPRRVGQAALHVAAGVDERGDRRSVAEVGNHRAAEPAARRNPALPHAREVGRAAGQARCGCAQVGGARRRLRHVGPQVRRPLRRHGRRKHQTARQSGDESHRQKTVSHGRLKAASRSPIITPHETPTLLWLSSCCWLWCRHPSPRRSSSRPRTVPSFMGITISTRPTPRPRASSGSTRSAACW